MPCGVPSVRSRVAFSTPLSVLDPEKVNARLPAAIGGSAEAGRSSNRRADAPSLAQSVPVCVVKTTCPPSDANRGSEDGVGSREKVFTRSVVAAVPRVVQSSEVRAPTVMPSSTRPPRAIPPALSGRLARPSWTVPAGVPSVRQRATPPASAVLK